MICKMDIKEKIRVYENVGFRFYPAWTMDEPRTPDRIELPSGKIFSLNEIDTRIKNLSEIGEKTRKYRELRMANKFYDLIRELDAEERYAGNPASFRDEEDMDQCAERYKEVNPFI